MFGIAVRLLDVVTGKAARVDSDGAVSVHQKRITSIPYSEYLTNTGLPTGSSQMAITTGTLAAPVLFYVQASNDYNILLTKLKFFISGSAAVLNEFGTGTALTNGCRIYFINPALGEVQLNPLIKSNYDLVRLAGGNPAFGSSDSAYILKNAIGIEEAFHPVVNLYESMQFGRGILLEKGSKQKFIIEIRDDTLTSRASAFNCIADGEQYL